ncbi:hypothetical protein GCM10010441_10970 [Kitasatospora paracochleata]|uniref:Uncharacterized membrane protein YsdA (DUF1294 family) n=1 Tax=Kitasatospora paracochleata TaxID=58354 RepID=A0ABT1J271_9ACTN|nr:VanZ family protein [Kitasatospora paracochleata]MCP2311478.1 uncharacterized membrane protein YsdA (DUF1294 family) [Kitasatospora paracochleata]
MDHTAALPAPARRTRRIRRIRRAVLAASATLGAALVAFVAQRPLRHRHTGWHAWVGTVNGVVVLTVAALPLAALVVWVSARRRTAAGVAPEWARRRSLAEVGMVYGTVPWVWMTMLPGSGAGVAPRRVSLVPLRDLIEVVAGAPVTAIVQVVGNLLVLAALGFFAPVRFTALASVRRVLVLGVACSVLIETAQYVLWLDRVSSVDDVLVNAAGAALAARASRRWWRTAGGAPAGRPRSAVPAGR